jgi:hypothetical protein
MTHETVDAIVTFAVLLFGASGWLLWGAGIVRAVVAAFRPRRSQIDRMARIRLPGAAVPVGADFARRLYAAGFRLEDRYR